MAVPVVSGPLEGARATGARPDALVWLEGIAPFKSGPRKGEPRARARDEPGADRHLYELRDDALWYVGMTDAKCGACGVDHERYDSRWKRFERCGLCGGNLIEG